MTNLFRILDRHPELLASIGPLGATLALRIGSFLYPEALETIRQARTELDGRHT